MGGCLRNKDLVRFAKEYRKELTSVDCSGDFCLGSDETGLDFFLRMVTKVLYLLVKERNSLPLSGSVRLANVVCQYVHNVIQ